MGMRILDRGKSTDKDMQTVGDGGVATKEELSLLQFVKIAHCNKDTSKSVMIMLSLISVAPCPAPTPGAYSTSCPSRQ